VSYFLNDAEVIQMALFGLQESGAWKEMTGLEEWHDEAVVWTAEDADKKGLPLPYQRLIESRATGRELKAMIKEFADRLQALAKPNSQKETP
jgi:hypothetical protein